LAKISETISQYVASISRNSQSRPWCNTSGHMVWNRANMIYRWESCIARTTSYRDIIEDIRFSG